MNENYITYVLDIKKILLKSFYVYRIIMVFYSIILLKN